MRGPTRTSRPRAATRRRRTAAAPGPGAKRPAAASRSETAEASLSEWPRGIDVSHHNANVDWTAVAQAGIAFAYAKATEGAAFVDGRFATNWPKMGAAGLLRGAYHFFRPAADPTVQADHFCDTVGPIGVGDLPHVVDVEATSTPGEWEAFPTPDARLDRIEAYVERVRERAGRAPMLYTSAHFWRDTLGNSTRLADLPLWIARYGAAAPAVPGGWKRWTMWQHSDRGTVEGIRAPVDVDRFNGTLEALQAFVGVAPAPEEAPPIPAERPRKATRVREGRGSLKTRAAPRKARRRR